MGLQLISIWGLQLLNGNVYFWVGLLSAMFMAGLAVGAAIFRRYRIVLPEPRYILILELGMCIWIILWWALIVYKAVAWPMLFILSAGTGMLLGMEFPLLTATWAGLGRTKESAVAGKLYAADLLGGWIAALLCGAVLIPVWGIEKTIMLLLVLKAVSTRRWMRSVNSKKA